MTPIHPRGIGSPMLLGGAHAAPFLERAAPLGFKAKVFSTTLGQAAAVKMCRSVIINGVEALLTESMLAARHYGVEKPVLDSRSVFCRRCDWDKIARYFISRSLEHGVRRAEEMREAAKTAMSRRRAADGERNRRTRRLGRRVQGRARRNRTRRYARRHPRPHELFAPRSRIGNTMKHMGSCHCGDIAFEAEGDLQQALECNCSHCSRKGLLLWFVPRAQFTLLKGAGGLTTYKSTAHHRASIRAKCVASRSPTAKTGPVPNGGRPCARLCGYRPIVAQADSRRRAFVLIEPATR